MTKKVVITGKASTTIYPTGRMRWLKRRGILSRKKLQQEWEIAYGDCYETEWRDIPLIEPWGRGNRT